MPLPMERTGGVIWAAAAALTIVDVTPSTTTKEAEGPSETTLPDTVMAWPAGTRVCPPLTKVLPLPGNGVKTSSPTGMTCCADGEGGVVTVEVTPLMTTADPPGASDNVVPETVIACPPGTSS